MWAKPKVSVFKNGQFRDPFFLRKIFFFWKNKKLFSPLLDNFFLFFEKIVFSIFFEFFFMDTFFVFRTLFWGGFFWKKQVRIYGQKHFIFFSKKIPPKKVSEKQKKCPFKKKFEKNGKNIFSKNKKKLSFLKGRKRFLFFSKKNIFLKTKESLNCPFLKTNTFGFAHI